MKPLPPFTTLQAFESAARLGNFTHAARERSLSHGAISRHISSLEAWCGQQLFERNGPQIKLSPAGKALQMRLAEPLQQLYGALGTNHRPLRQQLYVFSLVSFASTWLIPRLARFKGLNPHIDLKIVTDYSMTSLMPDTPAVALRFGFFESDGLIRHRLFSEVRLAVASPAWLTQYGNDPTNWPPEQMLRHTDSVWPARLKAANGSAVKFCAAGGFEFNDGLLTLQAAIEGLGVAWTRKRLAEPALRAGTLKIIPHTEIDADKAYWLAYRAELGDHLAIVAMRDWLFTEMLNP